MLKDLCFEIIEKCPNNCKFCSSNSCYDKDKIISFDKFKETIDYFMVNGGIEELSLSGGEPFLHPDLSKMIAYAKKYGIRVVVFTSGIRRSISLSKDYKSYYEKLLNDRLSEVDKYEKDNEFVFEELNIYGLINNVDYLKNFQTNYMKPNSTFTALFSKRVLEKVDFKNII